jgi:TRAP-type mannitol/chloroaromatic compound transport system substrate-binding protein
MEISKPPRRKFLGTAAVGVGLAGFPMISSSQSEIKLKFQSTWPAKFIYQEFANDWVKKASELSGGKLKIEMLPAGSVVPGLQVVDAVSSGVLDGGHGLPGFWFGKNPAFGLYGAGPDFGMDSLQLLGWIRYGGGMELYQEIQAAAKLNIVSYLYGPVPCEPLGWFKKEIKTVADLKGLKFRTAGLAVDLFNELGMSTVQMAPADIVPALDRGLLDGAEFASATDDRIMGFPDVAKFYLQQSYHMSNNFCEILINKTKFDSFPNEIKQILQNVSDAATSEMVYKSMDRMSADLNELQTKQKVKAYITPKSILDAQLKAWDRVIEKRSKDNLLFEKIVNSQKNWSKRVAYWYNVIQVDRKIAYNHYFSKQKA